MALRIRLQRHGAAHRPFYRVVVAEASARRDGRFVELVGTYDPQNKEASEQSNLKMDRVEHWIKVGAKPTETVASLIKKAKKQAVPAV